jgi:hypothetical protein
MDEKTKMRVIYGLSALCVILFISTISSCNNSMRQKAARDKEMASRLDSEEKASKVSQEQSKVALELKSCKKELEDAQSGLEAAKKALTQEKMIEGSLKEELNKVSNAKEALEESLKQALAGKTGIKK